MATNPMQRKARNSFLLGVLLMLVISAIIIGGLVMLLVKTRQEQKAQEAIQAEVYVLNSNVKSGQIITQDMLSIETVPSTVVPANAIEDIDDFIIYSLKEKATGNEIKSEEGSNGQPSLYIDDNGKKTPLVKDGDQYYKTVNNQRVLVEFLDYPLVAKVDMQANSIVTTDLLARSNEVANDDLRIQEYNMLMIPVKINPDDYIDVRLTLPSGQDYVVISKKRVLDVIENTVWLQLSEEEILTMSNAIVEAYQMTGSKLYVNLYVEPGIQADATPTYAVSQEVLTLIQNNPNIREKAKTDLFARYTQAQVDQRQNNINTALNQYAAQAQANIEEKVKEENEKRQELREKYLEELEAATMGVE